MPRTLDEFLLEHFYKHFANQHEAFEAHVQAMTAGHALNIDQIHQIGKVATATIVQLQGTRVNMKCYVANGIALEDIQPGQIIGAYRPIVTLPPAVILKAASLSTFEQTMTRFCVVFLASFHVITAEQAFQISAMFPPQVYKTMKWQDIMLPTLTMMTTFADLLQNVQYSEPEMFHRLCVFALFMTYVVRCPDACACEILYPPEYYDLVTDNVHPNAMPHRVDMDFPFWKQGDVGSCMTHFMPRVVYAQHAILTGQYITIPSINPFSISLNVNATDDKKHPALHTIKTSEADFDTVVFKNMLLCGKMQPTETGDYLKRLTASLLQLAGRLDDLNVNPKLPTEWPCTMSPVVAMHMFLIAHLLQTLDLELPECKSAIAALEKYVPKGFSTMLWPGVYMELYCRLCRFYTHAAFDNLRKDMYILTKTHLGICPADLETDINNLMTNVPVVYLPTLVRQ